MTKLIRQGDVLLQPIPKLPEGAVPDAPGTVPSRVVLAYGEATGHHHLGEHPPGPRDPVQEDHFMSFITGLQVMGFALMLLGLHFTIAEEASVVRRVAGAYWFLIGLFAVWVGEGVRSEE